MKLPNRYNEVRGGFPTAEVSYGCGGVKLFSASELEEAIHGAGLWEPQQVAPSVETFAKCIEEFSRLAVGRSTPVEREANPVSDEERKAFLRRIAQLNETNGAPEFWDVLLEC